MTLKEGLSWHFTERLWDKRVQRDDEMSDSEDEGEGGRRNRVSHADVDMVISGDITNGEGNGLTGDNVERVASSVREGTEGRMIGSGGLDEERVDVSGGDIVAGQAGQTMHVKVGNSPRVQSGGPGVVAGSSSSLNTVTPTVGAGNPLNIDGTGTKMDQDGDEVMN